MADKPVPNDPAQKPPLQVRVQLLPDAPKPPRRFVFREEPATPQLPKHFVLIAKDSVEIVPPRPSRRRGDPNAADTVMFSVRLPRNLVRRIEAFQAERQAQIQGVALTRADAVRMILEQGLADPEQAPSDPQ